MGILKNISGIVDKGIEIIDQAVLDKDKANELKTDLVKSIGTLMLTGSGTSITKITICILVSVVTLVGTYIFLAKPASIEGFKDYALSVTPQIGILIGAYGTGATIQKVMKNGRKEP